MANQIPDSPDALLRREPTAGALTASGFPTKASTLATKATRGGGPPYRSYGRIPLYRWGDALAWAQSRLSAPRASTSEAEGQEEPRRDPPSQLFPVEVAAPRTKPGGSQQGQSRPTEAPFREWEPTQ
jgi:hypothetical protein